MFKPKIRILRDGMEGYEAWYWAGLFRGGYSTIARVSQMTWAEAWAFYRKVLTYDAYLRKIHQTRIYD